MRDPYPERSFGGFSACDGTVAFFNRVQALLPTSGTVLDVGCGRGSASEDLIAWRRQLTDLRGAHRRVIGIDVDDAGRQNPHIDEFQPITAPEWPIPSDSVDLLISDHVLEHLEHPHHFFVEVHRVLRPGGIACLRTPNRWGYVAVASSVIPQRLHAAVVGRIQERRAARDVFPTFYRANTARFLKRILHAKNFDVVVLSVEAEPNYFAFSPFLYRVMSVVHRVIPRALRASLQVFARKR